MSQSYRPSSSHSHPLPVRTGPPAGMPSPPQTGYAYSRPPSHATGPPPSGGRPPTGTVLPGIDELIRGMPRDQVPPGPSVNHSHPHSHPQHHPQEPDYSRIRGPASPPWPNTGPQRNDSAPPPYSAYSPVPGQGPPRPPTAQQGGPLYTPPNSGGSRPPTGLPPQGMQPPVPHMIAHGSHLPAGTSPLPYPSVTYATGLPGSPNGSPGAPVGMQVLPGVAPGVPLDGPYYLTSHPYTTIYFAPPNQFGPARNARACKTCRRRKVRCSAAGGLGFNPGEPGVKCDRCRKSGEECIFEERQVSKKRGDGSTGSGGSGRASGSSGRSATADEDDDELDDDEESISTPTATTSTLRTPASSVASPAPRGSTKAQGPPPAPSSGAARGQGQYIPQQNYQQQGYGRAQSMPPK